MKYTIKESVLKNIVKKVIRESIEASSQEQYILDELVPRVKSWMEDVYQDWGGVEAVSPDALTDIGNQGDFELAVEETANEFNIDYDLAYKLCLKSNEIAYEQFKAEHINEAKVVTKFTPYTPEGKEQYILDELVPRIKSWMEDVYQDWGGVEAVSPDALTDFSNRDDFEESVEAFAHEFNISPELSRKITIKATEIAYEKFKNELAGVDEAKVVTKFTPYTQEEKEQNFSPFTRNDGRTAFQRNPSYEAALKAAQERMQQKHYQKNESVSETKNYGAGRVASDSNYANRWRENHVEPIFRAIDYFMSKGMKPDKELFSSYQTLRTLYNSHPFKVDSRLIDIKEEIKDKLIEIEKYVQSFFKRESKVHVKEKIIDEAVTSTLRKFLKEDHYSYNGLERDRQNQEEAERYIQEQEMEKIIRRI